MTRLALDIEPAAPNAEVKRAASAAILGARDEILELSHRIHSNPEPAYKEELAATWVAQAVANRGFRVERPAGRLATGIRATRRNGAGGDKPRIGVLAEYDALPGLGHGCGHNTMAASGVGAAIGLAAVSDGLPGEIVFLGTPAEEHGSGKRQMVEDGLFDGLDAALLYHPCDRNHVEIDPLASEDIEVVFHGLQAHASSNRWEGRNALDAMILLFSSVGLWRQQMQPGTEVHGIIREGGTAANIIPERTSAWFMLRSHDESAYRRLQTRFEELCRAAALATETEVEVSFSGGARTMLNNPILTDRWRANMAAFGITDEGPDAAYGSTDMGNVSWVVPAIHPDLAAVPRGTPGHSIAFRDASAAPQADDVTLLAAMLVAHTAIDLYLDPALVEASWRAFVGEGSRRG